MSQQSLTIHVAQSHHIKHEEPTTLRDPSQYSARLWLFHMLPSSAKGDLEQGLRSWCTDILLQLAERAKLGDRSLPEHRREPVCTGWQTTAFRTHLGQEGNVTLSCVASMLG